MKWASIIISLLIAIAPNSASGDVKGSDGRIIECFCTDRHGDRHELGDIICLTVGERSYMAKCVMAQNVPFWRDQNMGCLSSKVSPPLSTKPRQFAALCMRKIRVSTL